MAGPSTATRRPLRHHPALWWLNLGCYVFIVVFSLLQRVGQTTFDTKFDLTADPGRFLDRSLHLWNSVLNFGELQNQAYGYLFPQGLWFWLFELAHIPDWVTQRLWSAALLLIAYEGARRLCRALGIGNGAAPILAGLAYAVSPRLLGLVGVLSAEVLPSAVLPWIALPLVLGLRGRLSPAVAGLSSGVALLFVGGVNAVEDLAALPLAAFLVLSGLRTAHGRRLAGWWALGTTLAALWWMLPLLVLGKYSPPFLDFIETADTTTAPLGWANVLRGADHWLAFVFVGGRSWWPGAYDLATAVPLVLLTGLVAALGYLGLFRRDMPMRGPLVASLLTGLICLTVARGGDLATPIADTVRSLLDGSLAPLRNVHKVDPIIRLPLALGLAHQCVVSWAWLRRTRPWRSLAPRRRAGLRWVAVGMAVALLAGSAWPLFDGRLRKPGWKQVPDAWSQAADYLADTGTGTTLVLPGSGFGQQWWGWTIDEPIQGVATAPWAARSQVPLVPGSTIRFLDSIEERLEDGIGSPGLADRLASAGIQHVLVRRDIDLLAADVPDPSRVDAALAATPGFEHEKSFGRSGFGDQAMIEVYRVDRQADRIAAPERESMRTIAGGSDDILTARELGLVKPGESVLIGNGTAATPPDVVGDGYRRQERQFGRLHDSLSQVMTSTEPYRNRRAAHDYPGVPGIARVHAAYRGVDEVVASSSRGYADSFGAIRPELGPASAVDGTLATTWQSDPFTRPDRQWLELDFDGKRPIESVRAFASVGGLGGLPVRRVELTAGDQRVVAGVDPVTGEITADFNGSPVSSLRISVTRVAGNPSVGAVGLSEVQVAGTRITRSLVLPVRTAGASTSMMFRARPPRRACVPTFLGPQCSFDNLRAGSEQTGIERTFSLTEAGTWELGGSVMALATEETARLFQPVVESVARTTGTSWLASDPQVAPMFATDGDPSSVWLAGQGDTRPQLRITLPAAKTVTGIQLTSAAVPSTSPRQVEISGGGEQRVASLRDGIAFFSPLRARRVTLTFTPPEGADLRSQPIGVAEVKLRGADVEAPVDRSTTTGALCGLGPDVVVNGRRHPTEVRGTIDQVIAGQPMRWRVCDGPVTLPAGEQSVSIRATEQFTPYEAVLASTSPRVTQPASRDVSVQSWSGVERRVTVGAGEAAVLQMTSSNRNDGWRATAGGKELEPITVDGWQQGFVLPAGERTVVDIEYAPDTPYRLALLIGLVAAILLLVLTVVAWRRSPGPQVVRPPTPLRRGRWSVVLAAVPLLGLSWLLAGPGVLAGVVVGLVLLAFRRTRALAGPVGALGVVAAAVLSVFSPQLAAGRPMLAADIVAAVSLGLMMVTLLPVRRKDSDARAS